MDTQDMFAGFSLAAGKARFDEQIKLGGEPNDCKLSAQDTDGALCVFEFTGSGSGPRHRHNEQDEWIYIIDGEFDFHVGAERFVAGPGQSVFIPRRTPHDWAAVNRKPGKVINTYQPAGKMEAFFRSVGSYSGARQIHDALSIDEMRALFHEHGMDLLGPPPVGEWKVDENRRIVRTA